MFGSVLLMAALAAGLPQVQVSTVDGTVTQGSLEDLSSKEITLKTADSKATFSASQMLDLSPQQKLLARSSDEQPSAWIELIDGSKLTAVDFATEGDSVTLGYNSTGKIPASSIRSVRFFRPDDPASPAWPKDAGANATGDLLVVRKRDQIDFMEGSIVSIKDNYAVFKADGVEYPVNRSKIDGIIYYHKVTDKLSEPLCVVETTTGWRLRAKDVSYVSPNSTYPYGRLEVTTLCGDDFYFLPWEQVARLDFSAGKITYLSDLEPESTQWTPYLDFGSAAPAMAQYYAPRRDEGREHQPLRLEGKTCSKGLALYSRTALEYRVPAGMKQFKATAGIDDSVREAGNVRLQISADGNQLFDQVLTGKDAPVDLELNVAGAKRLSILVDYGDHFDAGDFLDLVDARMLK
ncbi:MAG TPA: NPCBM/NEW2 domain-containing protein [Pirellulales bacterium]|jgi:hypothetical protein|nr:NPCBM/NEW2 domain-containing protein [Pirellulales bacterium]